jgi:alanine racemase
MITAVEAHIDLTALQHNLKRVQQAAPNSKIMAVIKANGYGHGMLQVAEALSGVDAFAVARLYEAVQLREAGINTDIAILEGFQTVSELEQFAQHNFQAVIHHQFQIEMLEKSHLQTPLQVWLKIDSGMHRMGVPAETANACWQRLQKIQVVSNVRLMTHLASADDRRSEQTEQQLDAFKQAIVGIQAETSIANSAGILGWPQSHCDWVRPGIMLYGVSPFIGGWGEDDDLQGVMSLTSRLIAINHFKRGDAIGYGASWACPEDMPIGVVACGYGDGYPRNVTPGTMVRVNGRRVPLVGRVSMDSICVDLRQQPDAEVGDHVLLWGEGLPVEEIAEAASTIPYELLCAVTSRVAFHYIS